MEEQLFEIAQLRKCGWEGGQCLIGQIQDAEVLDIPKVVMKGCEFSAVVGLNGELMNFYL